MGMKTYEGWGKCSNCGLNADGWWQVDDEGNGSYYCSQGCKQTTKDEVDLEIDLSTNEHREDRVNVERKNQREVHAYTGQLF